MRLARLCWHSRAGKGNSRRDLAGQGGERVFQLALKTDACVRVLLEVAVENVGDDEVAGAVGMSDGAVFRCLNVHVCLCPQHPEGGIAPQTKIARHPIQDDGQPLGTVFPILSDTSRLSPIPPWCSTRLAPSLAQRHLNVLNADSIAQTLPLLVFLALW